jgi:threonine synthase
VVVDTHTADAFRVALDWPQPDGVPVVVLETAQACKFPETIGEALGKCPESPPELVGIEELPQRVDVMPPDPELMKAYIGARIKA